MVGRSVVVALFALVVPVIAACGSVPALSSPDLPRTTSEGIHLSVEVTEELITLMGCHTFWYMSHDGQQPPPGACEKMETVRSFAASKGADAVRARIVGEHGIDPNYLMTVAGWGYGEDLTLAVVIPPPDATELRMRDSTGAVLDRVVVDRDLVALAGSGSDVTVEALDGNGAVMVACPRQGITIDDVIYPCTFAPGIPPPITTVP